MKNIVIKINILDFEPTFVSDAYHMQLKENHWAYKVIKEERKMPVIIDKNELTAFLYLAKETFGLFNLRCLYVSII
jgi:hypothetical protein